MHGKNNWYLKSKGRVNKLYDEKKLQKIFYSYESITESEIELWLSSKGNLRLSVLNLSQNGNE